MSPGAILGLILMLAAVVWCLASLTRVLIGPHRKLALVRSGQSVLVFFVGFIVVGIFGGRPQEPAGNAATTAMQSPAALQLQEEIAEPVLPNVLQPETSELLPSVVPTVAARYQTSPTLVSLVIVGIDAESAEELQHIAAAECAGADFCSIGFWTDDAMAPRTLRMSDQAVQARIAHYVHSRATGLNTLKWNCDLFPSVDNCL